MRRQLNSHPIRTLTGLLAVAFVLFMISGIPAVKNARGWTLADVIGYITWFGFLLTFLTFLVCAAYVGIAGFAAGARWHEGSGPGPHHMS